MIIKDKPFRIPACQAMLCWYYASPVVSGLAIPSSSGCEVDLVRRWPGFPKLEAYQVRLSRLLVLRRLGLAHDWRPDDVEWMSSDWFLDTEFEERQLYSGGGL